MLFTVVEMSSYIRLLLLSLAASSSSLLSAQSSVCDMRKPHFQTEDEQVSLQLQRKAHTSLQPADLCVQRETRSEDGCLSQSLILRILSIL